MVCQKLNRALTYQMSRGAHVHVSNEWKWVTWYKNITTGSLSSEYYKLYSVANVDDLTWFNSNRTTHHNKWLSIILDVNLQCLANQHPVWRVIIYWDESFNSSWIVSIWQHQQPPFTDTCRIFSKCLANWHPVWRVLICCDKLFNSSQFVSIQQHFLPPVTDTCGIFSESLANWLPVCLFMS